MLTPSLHGTLHTREKIPIAGATITITIAIADLQDDLRLLLERDLIQLSPNDVRTLPAAFCAERTQRRYGPATTRLVTLFQALHLNWQPNGTVFEPTAKALNAMLDVMGAFDTAPRDPQRLVSGQVRRQDGRPIAGAIVRVLDMNIGGTNQKMSISSQRVNQ